MDTSYTLLKGKWSTVMSEKYPRAIFWFSNDLRIHDNPALRQASVQAEQLICVFCLDSGWEKPQAYGVQRLGEHRRRFLYETLLELHTHLQAKGQSLLVLDGKPIEQLAELIITQRVDAVFRSHNVGVYEQLQWQRLQESFPQLAFHEYSTHTLFEQTQALSAEASLEQSFSQFRKRMSDQEAEDPIAPIKMLPPPVAPSSYLNLRLPTTPVMTLRLRGGESRGLRQARHYFSTSAPDRYRETRNHLDDVLASTRLSPWLANGSLSVRQLALMLDYYEQVHGANESTRWIYSELLWREYFQWYAQVHGKKLFRFSGIGDSAPLTTFYPQRFKSWCEGATPWPIVNACMNQLNKTGYMSNRGRQIVASALVNELELDWRCGAAYFEQQLIDYDVASNWANWQYIAGVGADPRGGRHFNLEKQAAEHDPEGEFIQRWGKGRVVEKVDSVDAVDWPLE